MFKKQPLPPIIHAIFTLKALSHAQYAKTCVMHFENDARDFIHADYDTSKLGELEIKYRELKFTAELFLALANLHRLMYVTKESDEARREVLIPLISFFSPLVLDTVTTKEDNLSLMLMRHFTLLLHNIALAGCVFCSYLAALLCKAAGVETFDDAREYLVFLKGKIILFITLDCITVDRLHVH